MIAVMGFDQAENGRLEVWGRKRAPRRREEKGRTTHPFSAKTSAAEVFWACGVTPQEALRAARLPLAITHAPGHMFVADLQDDELCVPWE